MCYFVYPNSCGVRMIESVIRHDNAKNISQDFGIGVVGIFEIKDVPLNVGGTFLHWFSDTEHRRVTDTRNVYSAGGN